MKIIEINNISKKYRKNGVLSDLSVSFNKGLCYMIIGANGVGKSTFLKCLLGLANITDGIIIRNYSTLGYVPEKIILPTSVSVYEFLETIGLIKNIREYELHKIIDFELSRWKMLEKRNAKIGSLSKGMMQKIIIIQAIMNNSDLVVFDEVLNGLDINMQNMFFKIIKELKNKGTTIILTSHYPKQYKNVIDEVYEINEGNIKKIQKFD